MQPTSIILKNFVGNLRIAATKKNSVRIVKGLFLEGKKTLQNSPYFEEKQVTYRHI